MKNTIRFSLIILLIAIFNRCGDVRYPIILTNNSKHSIGCYLASGGYYGTQYPDTLLSATNQYIIKDIKSGGRYYYDSMIRWEEIFPKLRKDTLSIFIFHNDVLAKYTWDDVRDQYMILKRYDLSLDDLRYLNFKIPYPPVEMMKDMKMYPPYGGK